MARETSIDLKINSNIKDVNKDIKNTTKNVEELGKATENTSKEFDDYGKKASDSLKKADENVKKVTDAVKSIKGVGNDIGQNLAVIEEGFQIVGVESEVLAGSIEKVDQAMSFVKGAKGLADAGKGFINFGQMGVKALKMVKVGLISSGIGAIIVGIGVAIGLVISYWDDVVGAFTGEGTSGISKAIRIAFAPIFLTIEAVKFLIEGLKMLWSIITTGSTEAYEQEKKRQAQLDETIEKNEELLKASKKQQKQTEKQIATESKLADQRKKANDERIAQLDRELALAEAQNGSTIETIKLAENLAKEKATALTQELEDQRNLLELDKKRRSEIKDQYNASTALMNANIQKYGIESKQATEAIEKAKELKEAYTDAKDVVTDALKAGRDLANDQKDAINEAKIAEISANKERSSLYKEYRDKRISFERELFDEQINSIAEGYEKERSLLTENYRRQREDIMLNEDLTAKQKKELIEANKKSQDHDIEQMEIDHQDLLNSIDSEAEDLRISMIKNNFDRQKAELDKAYQEQLADIEKNEQMTEEQKTKLRLLYKAQRDEAILGLELENNQKLLEAQITLAQAKEIQAGTDFEASMEYKKQQLELQRELDLSEANITAEQKLLIEAEYQNSLQQLREETEEHRKELDEQEIEAFNQKLDLVQQGLSLISESTDFFNDLQVKSINKKYDAELKSAEGNEEAVKAIEKRKVEELNKANLRAFRIKKATDLASATIDGYRAVLSTYAQTPGGPIIKGIAASVAGAFSALNIAKIASTEFEGATFEDTGGSSASGAGAGAGDVVSPNFNVVGDSGVNQLEGLDQTPVQAYVVSGNITTAQSLDRNRVENATI